MVKNVKRVGGASYTSFFFSFFIGEDVLSISYFHLAVFAYISSFWRPRDITFGLLMPFFIGYITEIIILT